MKKFLIAIILFNTTKIFAQDTLLVNPLTISGYAEVYYSYDFNRPVNNNKPGFIYSHPRNNEVNLNLAFIKAAYNSSRVRGNLAIATGNYMNANYAAEPGVLKNIYEANAGIKLSGKANLWVDAGIFSSHIGFESAVSKDCWTLTRSLLAENSPYYEAGAKISYTSNNGKWLLSALYLNGWQRITRVDGNTTPAFGTQVTFKPSDKLILNSSTFIGNDKPDSSRRMRYFHNFYGILQVTKQLAITTGFDYGLEQQQKGSRKMNHWYSPVVIIKVNPNDKNSIAIRGEYYQDKHGIIIASGTPNGFKTFGWSINYDHQLYTNAVWRIEYRGLSGKDAYFIRKDNAVSCSNSFITTSLALSF